MYKAIKEIGGYKVGDEVPADKAKIWLEMYAVPHLEEVSGDGEDTESKSDSDEGKDSDEEKDSEAEESSNQNPMLDDYLSRNTNVVIKNVEEDDLSKEQLENLLKLESATKERRAVIKAINKRINN